MMTVADIAVTLFASTVLMFAVLAVRRPIARRFGAHAAYALWALPALRLLMPKLPSELSPMSWLTALTPSLAASQSAASADAGTAAVAAASPAAGSLAAMPGAIEWSTWLVVVWLAGACAWTAWQLWRHQNFLTEALRPATSLGRHGGVEVLLSSKVPGPMAIGIRHPRILLPADFTSRYAADERRLAIAHEAAHHDRGDIIANVAALIVMALHWWNPVAHIAWRAFRADQELACDATVLAGGTDQDRHAYGCAILKSACARIPSAACAMNTKVHLKERITMIKHHDVAPGRRRLGMALGALVVTAGLSLSASAQPTPPAAPAAVAPPKAAAPPAPPQAPAAPTKTVRTIIIKDGKAVESGSAGKTIVMIPRDAGKDGKTQPMGLPDDMPELLALEALATSVADRATATAGTGAGPRIIVTCRRSLKPGETTPSSSDDCQQLALATAGPSTRDVLLSARKSIEASTTLSNEQRRAALAGLDKAIVENTPPQSTR